jgi:hypothetical protein
VSGSSRSYFPSPTAFPEAQGSQARRRCLKRGALVGESTYLLSAGGPFTPRTSGRLVESKLGARFEEDAHVSARQDRVEHGIGRLVNCVSGEVDGVLGPFGAELRALEVLLGLSLVDSPADVLTVVVPIAPELLPVSLGVICAGRALALNSAA